MKANHVTRKVIQMWKYSKQEEKFIMQNEKESPRMETQLMRAANNDIFFVRSGGVAVCEPTCYREPIVIY